MSSGNVKAAGSGYGVLIEDDAANPRNGHKTSPRSLHDSGLVGRRISSILMNIGIHSSEFENGDIHSFERPYDIISTGNSNLNIEI